LEAKSDRRHLVLDELTSMFRTIENSDPKIDFEGLRFVTVKSPSLGGRADVTLFAPYEAEAAKEVPLITLLHGVYGSHWGWAMRGFAHRTLQRLVSAKQIPTMALAMPSDGLWGDGSGYLPHAKQDFEKWIVEEVPAAAATGLTCVSNASPLLIAGLSMGGFGALRIAAKYGGKYRAVAGHSSITHFEQMKMFVAEDLADYNAKPDDHSVFETMLRNRASLPPIRFDCGTEDPLIEQNRTLHRQLEASGISHVYEEFAGGHDWKYWETHLADTLRFFGRVLSPRPGA
jgi:putative tributyrin esterase